MRVLRSAAASLVAALAASAAAAPSPTAIESQSTAGPSVSLSSTTLTATGVAPGGEVIVFGRTVEPKLGGPRLEGGATRLRDDDGDGAITIPISAKPPQGVWIVVDLRTGRYGTAWRGLPPQIEFIPRQELRDGGSQVQFSYRRIEIVYVRPGTGAWTAVAVGGGSLDADSVADAFLTVNLTSLTPLGDSGPAPEKTKTRDVLVVIEPRSLAVYATEAN